MMGPDCDFVCLEAVPAADMPSADPLIFSVTLDSPTPLLLRC